MNGSGVPRRLLGSQTRRAWLQHGAMSCIACALGGFTGAGHAADPSSRYAFPSRFDRPSNQTDEGGLWALMDREETKLRRSPFVIRDQALQTYILGLTRGLAGDHSQDVRVYLFRTPQFNASMAPNGMMQIWSGLMLRVENEAQLLAVVGHELGHYFERHTLARMQQAKGSSAAALLSLAFGPIGLLGSLAMIGSFSGFSRDQEREADRIGSQLLNEAGYAPAQAAIVWSNLIQELSAGTRKDALSANPLTGSHPAPAERMETLKQLANTSAATKEGEKEWFERIAPFRLDWILDEVNRGQHEESLALFDRLLKLNRPQPEIQFGKGEVLRLRNAAGDATLATVALEEAIKLGGEPALVHRSLGLLQQAQSNREAAYKSLDQYLKLSPKAPDAGLIRGYLQELKP
jgi:beta-barrel assembly-enhancing protease